MTPLKAAAFWIGLNAIFLIFISWRVGRTRIKNKIDLGDGGNEEMQRAMRAQGNYIEYAPASLLGLVVLAGLNLGALYVHILGAAFLLARIFHFAGLGVGVWPAGRFVGTLLTMLTLFGTALLLLWKAFS